VSGLDIEIVGWILLGVGAFGLAISLALGRRRRLASQTYVVNDPYDLPPGS
jgi:hypothetical protein